VADTGNATIRKIKPQGIGATFAGKPGQRGEKESTGPEAHLDPLGTGMRRSRESLHQGRQYPAQNLACWCGHDHRAPTLSKVTALTAAETAVRSGK
jgi:hypothetical protein